LTTTRAGQSRFAAHRVTVWEGRSNIVVTVVRTKRLRGAGRRHPHHGDDTAFDGIDYVGTNVFLFFCGRPDLDQLANASSTTGPTTTNGL